MAKKVASKKTAIAKKTAKVKKQHAKKATVKKGTKDSKGKKDLMCFLTSACVRYYGLPDNCHELETLRTYRDNYLLSSGPGRALVAGYYAIAPEIVRRIEQDKRKHLSYKYIYSEIRKACERISSGKNASAQAVYENLVYTLCKKYKT